MQVNKNATGKSEGQNERRKSDLKEEEKARHGQANGDHRERRRGQFEENRVLELQVGDSAG
jgi:hypothetical protein